MKSSTSKTGLRSTEFVKKVAGPFQIQIRHNLLY